MRKAQALFHAVAGGVAMLIIATFWTSTLAAELFLGRGAVVAVKHSIVHFGLIPLILMMISVGASGNILGKGRGGRLIESKRKRMPIVALNGLLVMVPSALYLNHKAAAAQFDSAFYAAQAVELAVGLVQLTLLGMSFRDGLILKGRIHLPRPAVAGAAPSDRA